MSRKFLIASSLLATLLFPTSALAQTDLLKQGLDALGQGRYSEAVTALEQHTRLQPEDMPALQGLAEAYLELGQKELAEATLKAAQAKDRNQARTHLLRGRLRYAQQDYDRARSELRTVIYLKQPSAELWYYLALTSEKLGDAATQAEALATGLAASDAPPAVRARLLLLQARLQPDKSDAALREALTLKNLPSNLETEILNQQAVLLLHSDRAKELIDRQFLRIEAALADPAAATRLLSELETWLGQSENVDMDRVIYRNALEALQEKYPQDALLCQQLIQTYRRTNQYEKLLAFYQYELIQGGAKLSDSERAAALHRIADAYLKLNFLDLAYKNYESASKLDPRDLMAVKRMGVLYLVAKQPGESIKLFDRVRKEDPLDHENLLFLSLAMALKKQDGDARQLLAGVPAGLRPEVRARIEALLVSEQRAVEDGLWKILIPEDAILSGL